jgi:hypothetical protein
MRPMVKHATGGLSCLPVLPLLCSLWVRSGCVSLALVVLLYRGTRRALRYGYGAANRVAIVGVAARHPA